MPIPLATFLELEEIEFQSAPLDNFYWWTKLVDDENIDLAMLTYLANYHGRSFTACPNANDWLNAYEGADELYVVTTVALYPVPITQRCWQQVFRTKLNAQEDSCF